ncbi:hypothetical protein DV515_00009180, partial [Chloebia gouldiae]
PRVRPGRGGLTAARAGEQRPVAGRGVPGPARGDGAAGGGAVGAGSAVGAVGERGCAKRPCGRGGALVSRGAFVGKSRRSLLLLSPGTRGSPSSRGTVPVVLSARSEAAAAVLSHRPTRSLLSVFEEDAGTLTEYTNQLLQAMQRVYGA